MRRFLYVLLLVLFSLQLQARGKETKQENVLANDKNPTTTVMKLKITIGSNTATAVLYNNQASHDFAALLPLSLTLTDYNQTEKIANLPKKLFTKDAPAGFDPSAGDLTYFAPWGNLALFYKDFSYSTGLVSLGKITSGIEAFNVSGSLEVKIELDKK